MQVCRVGLVAEGTEREILSAAALRSCHTRPYPKATPAKSKSAETSNPDKTHAEAQICLKGYGLP